jgi:hypothetical protein
MVMTGSKKAEFKDVEAILIDAFGKPGDEGISTPEELEARAAAAVRGYKELAMCDAGVSYEYLDDVISAFYEGYLAGLKSALHLR